jgi:hypothetical protein
MVKRSSQEKSIVRYLLFTVIVLLVTVSLLSIFVFKYTNLVSDNVLGAHIEPLPSSSALLCGTCRGVIILQKDGTNSKNWGAKCVTQQAFNSSSNYLAYLICPMTTPSPRPSPVLTPSLRPRLSITPHFESTSR